VQLSRVDPNNKAASRLLAGIRSSLDEAQLQKVETGAADESDTSSSSSSSSPAPAPAATTGSSGAIVPSSFKPDVDNSGQHHWEEPAETAEIRNAAVSEAVARANEEQPDNVAEWVRTVEESGVRLTGKELWTRAPDSVTSSWKTADGSN
jgi:hypothetical protein